MKLLAAAQRNDTVSLIPGLNKVLTTEDTGNNILNMVLIQTPKFSIRIWDIIIIAFIVLLTIIALKLIKRAIMKSKSFDRGKQYALYNLTKYVVIIFAIMWIMQYMGVKLTLLLGGSAALLVGIGLGLQNLFSDFISGIILLVDSSIKVGDVIEVNDLVCQVKQIKLRTTQVETRDDKFILLPNSSLTKHNIINWTHSIESSRFDVSVGVAYDSDVHLVRNILLESVDEHSEVMKTPRPFVRLNRFADSSIDFTVYFWSQNIFRVENIKSDVRFTIFEKFNAHNVNIPFPQSVIHYYDKGRADNFKNRNSEKSNNKDE